MLRLTHNQTTMGAILVDDIDDGLPNKTVHRLGSTADPKAYARDGAAGVPKQPCYIPYSHTTPTGSVIPGFIDLRQTERVTFSAGQGKISKMVKAGLITVTTFQPTDVATPVVTAASSGGGNFTITGTSLSSVSPDTTVVTLAQAGGASAPSPAAWSQAAILTAGGAISGTSITIPTAAFVGQVPVAGNTVRVNADEKNSNTFVST